MELFNKQKKVLYFRLFNVASFFFSKGFELSWHSLSKFHEVVTWGLIYETA